MTSNQAQQILNQAQAYQQQLQSIMMQKENIKMHLQEIKRALEELGKMKEDDVYKISGPVLIKSNKKEVTEELEEKKESAEARIKTLERGEEMIKAKTEGLREKISKTDSGAG